VANSDPEVRYSRGIHSVALYDFAKPHFQIRSCHCFYELEKFCKTHVLRRDIKVYEVTLCGAAISR
jgi:hypothetical protein